MIAETGHFSLILALALAVLSASLPLYGAAKGDARLIALAPSLATGQFLLVAISFAALTHAYLVSDFSVLNVALNSHTLKPLLYKISGVWGNHEGSLLLWVLILSLFGAAVAVFGRNLPPAFRARVLAVQAMIAIGFFLFILLTSNPFERVAQPPSDGNGLNPLLQDPGLAFHPPFLYLGYVGFSIAFAFAIAALIEGKVSPSWARWVRPWTLAAWAFLTLGIALGSWWAYYELGWGGFWFWDPVENASFMPWLVGTALLHSAIVVEKRDTLKSWTILLAILTFSFSLLGTFLVRSGVLTSVHAFATDPARGIFILIFLGIVVGGSLTLYAVRAPALKPGGLFAPVSREGALILNNLFLTAAAATVLLGTLFPLFLDALTGEKISVGSPYFNITFSALMTPLVLTLVFGPLLPWKKGDLGGVMARLKLAAAAAIAAILLAIWLAGGSVLTYLGIGLAAWLAAGVLTELGTRANFQKSGLKAGLKRLAGLPRAHWGMASAHFGVAVAVFGITASSSWTTEELTVMRAGEEIPVSGYNFAFQGATPIAGPNYTAIRGHFTISRGGQFIADLYPEDRSYSSPPMQTTEAAIHALFTGDLYAVVGESLGNGAFSVRLYFKPFVSWIWAGALIMALGGALSLSDRRLRVGAPKRTPVAQGIIAQPAE